MLSWVEENAKQYRVNAQNVTELEEEVVVFAIVAEAMGPFWLKHVVVVAEVSDMDCNCGGRFVYDYNANCMVCESCGCDTDGEPVWVLTVSSRDLVHVSYKTTELTGNERHHAVKHHQWDEKYKHNCHYYHVKTRIHHQSLFYKKTIRHIKKFPALR